QKLAEYLVQQQAAFQEINFLILTKPGTGIDADDTKHNVSHFLLQYAVDDNKFNAKTLIYPSRYVELSIRAAAMKLDFVTAVESLDAALRRNLPERARPLLETVTFGMLARKVDNW